MIRVPISITIPEHYFTKQADIVVFPLNGRIVAVDRFGNRFVEGDDSFYVLKKAMETKAKEKAGKSLVVYAFDLEGTVPAGDTIKLTKDVLGAAGLKLFELHCINCYWTGDWKGYPKVTFLSIHGDIVRNVILDGHGSTTFYDVGQVLEISSSDPNNVKIDMGRVEVRRYEAWIPDEYNAVGNIWGGFHIWFPFPGPISSDEEFHVDLIKIEDVKARPIQHMQLPEETLLFMPRAKRVIIRDVDAWNWISGVGYWLVIQAYGFWSGAEHLTVEASWLKGIIHLKGQDVEVSDSRLELEPVFAPLVSSVDDVNLVVNVRPSRLKVSNSYILASFQIAHFKKVVPEGRTQEYTIKGSISLQFSNINILLEYSGLNYAGGISGQYRVEAKELGDIDEIVIDGAIVDGDVHYYVPLVNLRFGGYVKAIKLSNIRIKDSYGRHPVLLYLSDGDVADLIVDYLEIDNVLAITAPDNLVKIGSSSATYKTLINKMLVNGLYHGNITGLSWLINPSATIAFDRIIPLNARHVDSGLQSVGAGATQTIGRVVVSAGKRLVVTELHLYDPDSAIKLQIYNVTDATVEKEIGLGSTEDIGWYVFAGGKTYEFRLVNTDTVNAHNANAKIIYAQMP